MVRKRDGSKVADVTPVNQSVIHPIYVSETALLIAVQDSEGAYKLESFIINALGSVESEVLGSNGAPPSPYPLNYPYLLSVSYVEGAQFSGEGTHTLRFYDLTSTAALKIVGDTVIGVHGSNLKVRWKTIAEAKYRVQISNDLTNWTDYTEIMDGNGSTMIVNVPLSEHSESVYARVVQY